ncbi:hypothetical protein P7C71_g4237, partial [Lecanoromycetidae sp. Uapishka_2]
MTSSSSLYGVPRPESSKKVPVSGTGNAAFTTTLSSLLASPSAASTTAGRTRPSKSAKDSIFTAHNKGTKKRALADISDDGLARPQSHAQSSETVDAATLHRSKRKMEEKARLYASMKRGDYVPSSDGRTNKEENSLVDFDRKWAETQEGGKEPNYDTSSDDGGDSESEELVDYEDEFGRQRRGTRTEAARELRQHNAQAYAAKELSEASARPSRPENLIHGDTIQAAAFNPDEPIAAQMDDLARKRDRSMTPPEEVHYDASKEVRSKGVGFYQFSKDNEGRRKEMEALERERQETEKGRKEREARKEAKRREIEERKKKIAEKRGERLADRFLDSLG